MEPKIKILIIVSLIAFIAGIIVFLVRHNKTSEPKDCVAGEWSNWSSCSVSCGGGTQKRTRVIKTAAINGGKCDVSLEETRVCNSTACPPVDCQTSVWTQFGPCENVNGVFKRRRTKTITRPASNGGRACPELIEEEVCPPVDCQTSDWTYGACTNVGGVLKSTRTKTITRPASNGGRTCPSESQLTETLEQECRLLRIQVSGVSHARTFSSWHDGVHDGNFNTHYDPSPDTPGRNMWIYFDILGASPTSLVYLTKFKIKFYVGPQNVSNTLSLYSDAGSILPYVSDIRDITYIPDKKIYEEQFTDPNIITIERDIIPPVPVHKLLLNFSRRTFVYEIQFFGFPVNS